MIGRAGQRRLVRHGLLTCALAMLAGCRTAATTPATTPMDGQGIERLGAAVAERPVPAEWVAPNEFGDWIYRVEGETNDPEAQLIYRRRPDDRFGAAWSVAQGDRRTEYFARDEHGNVILIAAIDHGDQALTRFAPPLIVAYASLSPGESRSCEAQMQVVDSRNPKRRREAGVATMTVSYVGDEVLLTPMGDLLAARLETEFRADLKMADVDNHSTLFVAEGYGPLIRHNIEEITVLGILPRRSEETLVLDSIELGGSVSE